MLEQLIAYHGGPTLAGIKPSNIISVPAGKYPALYTDTLRLNRGLNPSGIYFTMLCDKRENIILMVYRRKNLTNYLNRPEISELLTNLGYPERFDLHEYIRVLADRITYNNEFPHEIGAFLGYPIEDIQGFINHKNDGCIYTGCWRVYENAEPKIRLFERYDICRRSILKRVLDGATLVELFSAA